MYFTRKHLKSRALGAVNMIVSEPIGLERRVVVALLGHGSPVESSIPDWLGAQETIKTIKRFSAAYKVEDCIAPYFNPDWNSWLATYVYIYMCVCLCLFVCICVPGSVYDLFVFVSLLYYYIQASIYIYHTFYNLCY